MPMVSSVELWCFSTGTLMKTSASSSSSWTLASVSTWPLGTSTRWYEPSMLAGATLAPAPFAAASMPLVL